MNKKPFHLADTVIPFVDLHTHRKVVKDNELRVYNVMLNEFSGNPSHPFSAGLHPWHADQLSKEELSSRLKTCIQSPDLYAIGETGLDKICKISLKTQLDVFEFQLRIATANKLPVIIHCVKAWEELIEISANYHTAKILHGYNGGIQLTEQLLRKGFSFSIGKEILKSGSRIQSALSLIPTTRLFCETDTSELSISDIYRRICHLLKLNDDDLKTVIYENFRLLRFHDNTLQPG